MKFKSKYMRNTNRIKKVCVKTNKIQLVHKLDMDKPSSWEKIGFPRHIVVGDSLIPTIVGRATKKNLAGYEIIQRSLPKEEVDIDSSQTFYDWHGGMHTRTSTRTIMRYPRKRIVPSLLGITITSINDELYVSTDIIDVSDDSKLLTYANIMLEVFKEFELVDDSGVPIFKNSRILPWEIFPKGEYPWSKINDMITKTSTYKKSQLPVIKERMKLFHDANPSFTAQGYSGFYGYMVFGFEDKNIFILESTLTDNATYVFGNNWEELSKLTKNDILNGSQIFTRVIHDKSWKSKIKKLLS